MARREDAGGFFYSLGIDTDRGSFARASEAINGLVNTAKAAAIAIGAALTIKGTIKEATEDLTLSSKLGESVYELDKWKTASSIIGANFHNIGAEMDNLNKKFAAVETLGRFDQATAEAMARLSQLSGMNVDWESMMNMSPLARVQELLQAADKLNDKTQARVLLEQIMGGGTSTFFTNMQRDGYTLVELLEQASKFTLNTTGAKESLNDLRQEMEKTKNAINGAWTNIVGEMSARWLEPGLEKINIWIGNNKDAIQENIGKAFDKIEEVIETIVDNSKTIAKYAVAFGKDTWETMRAAWEKAEAVAKWIYDHTPHDVKLPGVEGRRKSDLWYLYDNNEKGYTMDEFFGNFWGIMGKTLKEDVLKIFTFGRYKSPDELSLLQGAGASVVPAPGGTANVTINQNFNVSGTPLPGQMRDMAYNGTTSAMGEAFSHAGMVVQMMPGTR